MSQAHGAGNKARRAESDGRESARKGRSGGPHSNGSGEDEKTWRRGANFFSLFNMVLLGEVV